METLGIVVNNLRDSRWFPVFPTHAEVGEPLSQEFPIQKIRASRMALVVKNPTANAGDVRDTGSISGLGRSPRGGCGNLVQYSCLENPMDREAWRATVHGVAESDSKSF